MRMFDHVKISLHLNNEVLTLYHFCTQFAKSGTLEQHGFARNRLWVIEKNSPPFAVQTDSAGKAFVDLLLKPSDEDLKIWPYRYEFQWLYNIPRLRSFHGLPLIRVCFHKYIEEFRESFHSENMI